jgi:hypothetical protein
MIRVVSSWGVIDFESAPTPSQSWNTPPTELSEQQRSTSIVSALSAPIDFPPLSASLVPGDRVCVPLDLETPRWSEILVALVETLRSRRFDDVAIEVLTTRPLSPLEQTLFPGDVKHRAHDPNDRDQLAYLASTATGSRIYLNRAIVEADLVVPVAVVRPDIALGLRGPWSLIYPDLSDCPRGYAERTNSAERPNSLGESQEVNWLLGARFQVAVIGASDGVSQLIGGDAGPVYEAASHAHSLVWSLTPQERADVVVAGIGAPGSISTYDAAAAGLRVAVDAVRQGGEILIATRLADGLPPTLKRLAGLENPGIASRLLQGAEFHDDFELALELARARSWAQVYWLGNWPEDVVSELGLIPLEHPDEARRLVAKCQSCLFLSRADLVKLTPPSEA